jgi:two-component system, chemotaxis family, chemotaxis protein CheY
MAQTVLIVDDSPIIRRRVANLLGEAGFEVLEATDGMEGSQIAGAHPSLCMIIADINMPRMNGLEMVAEIRARKSDIPVMMLTTEGNPQVIQNAKAAGAQAWLIKPFKNEHLLESVKRIAGGTAASA